MIIPDWTAVGGMSILERAVLAKALNPTETPLYCSKRPIEGQGSVRQFAVMILIIPQIKGVINNIRNPGLPLECSREAVDSRLLSEFNFTCKQGQKVYKKS